MPGPQNRHYDLLVVGGGILGLAHALIAGREGLRTAVFERHSEARGASALNFGMLWPIGQPAGVLRDRALRSLETWKEIFADAGIWNDPCGSLHLARHEDELPLLEQFLPAARQRDYDCSLLSPEEVELLAPGVRREGLHGALHSRQEILINPGQALHQLTRFLQERFQTSFFFETEVQQVHTPEVRTTAGKFHATKVVICCGTDFETLFPQAFSESGLLRCKLQMMKTAAQPDPWKLGAMVTDSLTFRHYQAFSELPAHAAMQERILEEHEDLDRLGITVLAAQNNKAELIIGDSHHTAWSPPQEDDRDLDEKILAYLHGMIEAPSLEIARRWSATYSIHPQRTEVLLKPAEGTSIVLASGGNGLTTSFALAQDALGLGE